MGISRGLTPRSITAEVDASSCQAFFQELRWTCGAVRVKVVNVAKSGTIEAIGLEKTVRLGKGMIDMP